MMRAVTIAVTTLLAMATASPAMASDPEPSAGPIAASRFGLYIVADDANALAEFYAMLFGPPQVQMPGFTGFDVAGGLLAIVDRRTYAAAAVRGDTVRAYIKVADIDGTFAKARRVAPDRLESAAVVGEGSFRFFRLRDPEGNVVEFFAVGPAA